MTGSGLLDERTRRPRSRGAVLWFRGRFAATVVVGCALEAAVSSLFRHLDPTAYVGVPGALGILVALVASLVHSARAGASVAFVGSILFLLVAADQGQGRISYLGLPVVTLWTLAAALAGYAAERQRRRTTAALAGLRHANEEAATLAGALEHVLEVAPDFHAQGSWDEVGEAICDAALQMFDCDAASIWAIDGEEFTLVSRRPPALFALGLRFPIDVVPTLRSEVIDRRHAAFTGPADSAGARYAEDPARSLGMQSVLRIPVVLAGEVQQFLAIAWKDARPAPSREVFVVAQRFADQAALALEQARRRELQREAAALHTRLESGLLPRLQVADPAVRLVTSYQAGERRLLLGGDFYDAVELRDGAVALLIGDVSGHGPDAAAVGATLRAAWRALVLAGADADGLLRVMQAVLERERDGPETFVTCACVWIDADRSAATVALAGHPPPLLLADGVHPLDAPSGPPLGALPDASWRASTVPLPSPSAILLYTDGLIEGRAAPGAIARMGLPRLAAMVREAREQGDAGEALVTRMLGEVRAANGAALDDDVAVVLVMFAAATASAGGGAARGVRSGHGA